MYSRLLLIIFVLIHVEAHLLFLREHNIHGVSASFIKSMPDPFHIFCSNWEVRCLQVVCKKGVLYILCPFLYPKFDNLLHSFHLLMTLSDILIYNTCCFPKSNLQRRACLVPILGLLYKSFKSFEKDCCWVPLWEVNVVRNTFRRPFFEPAWVSPIVQFIIRCYSLLTLLLLIGSVSWLPFTIMLVGLLMVLWSFPRLTLVG